MKSPLLNFRLLYVNYFLKTDRTCLKGFTNSFIGNSKKINNFSFSDLRSLCTSVETVKSDCKKDESLIYMGALTYQVKGVKVFSCMTSTAGIAIQPMLYKNISDEISLPIGVALCACIGFFTFVTPYLIHLITRKYVTEIWYNSESDTYKAILLSFFLRRIELDFKIKDISIPDVLPVFSTMYIKGKPLLIAADSFLSRDHFIKMMKYDEPIDIDGIFGSKKPDKS